MKFSISTIKICTIRDLSWLRTVMTAVCLGLVLSMAGQVKFSGNKKPVVEITPEASTGLNRVFVLHDTQGVSVTFGDATSSTTWQKYGNGGGGYAQDLPGVTTTLDQVEGNTGYIISYGDKRYYFWVVDYSTYALDLKGVRESSSDCSSLVLAFEGQAPAITYYSINGRSMELERDIQVSYDTQEYDEASQSYQITQTTQKFQSLPAEIYLPAPLCDTDVKIRGDKFLEYWGKPQEISTSGIKAMAVDCHASAEQTQRDAPNENNPAGGDVLGGSAPAEITFTAAVTQGAVFTEWQISENPEFEIVDYRFPETQVTHTFRDMGNYYARFVCANAEGSCESTSETYQIQIGESMLQCPNAFSPGASEGINDEWKVAYKSIVEFECHIFNRNGVKIISLTDPSQGWDGKYKGKLVPTGVYYYVIKARGSDGKKYELGGDINIVNYK